MKPTLLKVLSLMLTMVVLLGVTACAGDRSDNNTETSTQGGNNEETTESPYDSNGFLKDNLPGDLNYGNRTFNVLGWETPYTEFYVDTTTGDAVDDSIYERNMAVETRLGVRLNYTLIPGDNANQKNYVDAATSSILSGVGEYDLFGCYSMCAGTLATQSGVHNLIDLKYLDFSMLWWSDTLIEYSTVGDSLYFVTGDISNQFLYNLYFLIVNKNLLDSNDLDDPREMVKADTWTLDKMIEMTNGVYIDQSADGQVGAGDIFGYVIYGAVHADCWIAASGIPMASSDESGKITLTDKFTGEATFNLISKLNKWIWETNDVIYDTANGYNTIKSGNTLFGAVAGSTLSGFRDIDWVYGVLPYPKASDNAENYLTNLGFAYTNYCIPINASDADMSAAVLECLASESYRRSSNVLFDTVFKSRYSSDNLDYEMFDIIKSNIYVDMNRVFSSSFTWAQSAVALFRNSITGNANDWISKINGNKKYINSVLSNISNNLGSRN